MAKNSQKHQGSPANLRSGGGQSIVELCHIQASGLSFWSKQRFEIGYELQIRLNHQDIPGHSSTEEWVNLCGFVIQCQPIRREDGSPSFRITIVLDSVLMQPKKLSSKSFRFQHTLIAGLARIGLN
jgi:hypothetical protein